MSTKDLLAHQALNRERTIKQINDAMVSIEKSVKSLGYYPENNGRITVKEVCRKANVAYSTLKNPAHKATVKSVKDWLVRLRKIAPTAKADADVVKRERTKELIDQIENIANKFNFFKIDYNKLLEQSGVLQNNITDLEVENANLKREIVLLKSRIAELEHGRTNADLTNVIPFLPPVVPSL